MEDAAPPTSPPASADLLLPCPECDLVVSVGEPAPGQRLSCPRCAHPLVRHTFTDQTSPALAVTALVLLLVALATPYIGFGKSGLSETMSLLDAATRLVAFHDPLLGALVFATIVVLPGAFLLALLWVQLSLANTPPGGTAPHPLPGTTLLMRTLPRWRPWIMADVFAIGALISLIKIAGIADVKLLSGFWAYAGFALLLLFTLQRFQPLLLWARLHGHPHPPEGARAGLTASRQGLVGCEACGQLQPLGQHHCQRCGARLHPRHTNSLQRTWALLITAALCCFPAHLYPIMITTSLGSAQPSTIIAGVLLFVQHGDWPIALVIFVASVLIPFGKILTLAWLCLSCRRLTPGNLASQMRLYRITEWIGRWSMIDVFVVAIVVALVRLGNVLSIEPGPGGLAFAGVVVFTMLAALTFDPRLIWDQQQQWNPSTLEQERQTHEQNTRFQ